jgi:hypothetical protein
VSTQHQHIGEERDGPAPHPNLARNESIPPRGNGYERNNRGLRGKRLPGVPQEPPTLCIDRYSASESHDGPGREKDQGRDIAVANHMHQRPGSVSCTPATRRSACSLTRDRCRRLFIESEKLPFIPRCDDRRNRRAACIAAKWVDLTQRISETRRDQT